MSMENKSGAEEVPSLRRQCQSLFVAKQYDELENLVKTIALESRSDDQFAVWLYWGHAVFARKRYVDALARYFTASQMTNKRNDFWEARFHSAKVSFVTENYNLVLRTLQQMPDEHLRSLPSLWYRGTASRLLLQFDKSLALFTTLIARTVNEVSEMDNVKKTALKSAYLQRAKVKYEIGDRAAAEEDAFEAYKIDKNDPEILRFRAELSKTPKS